MDGSTGVWILGGYQSDFARNLSKENHDFAELTAEVVDATLAAAGVAARPPRSVSLSVRRKARDHGC